MIISRFVCVNMTSKTLNCILCMYNTKMITQCFKRTLACSAYRSKFYRSFINILFVTKIRMYQFIFDVCMYTVHLFKSRMKNN